MGRYINIPRNERKCKFCRSVIEDEYHFLMSCQLYQDLRKTFLLTEYTHVVNLHNFIKLMSTRDELTLRNIAMFIYYAFKRRKEIIQIQVVHQ